MKRIKIMKSYAVLWLFIYFLVNTHLEAMETFFFATLTFNLAVLTVLAIGIIVIFNAAINLIMLAGTFGTLAYKKDNLNFYLQGIDKIMPANIAHMFHSRAEKGVLLFTSEESRAVVEWIDEKFSNQSRYVNYFIGTALMIGLLGTFTGLLVSIDQMGKIILSLSGDIDLGAVIRSFSGPLGGMAVGFGSSLFGVITAIILGLMGYILNKNQETLIEGVEDWLKGRIIDSPSMGAGKDVVSTTEELPQHKSSFMDIFIDNISQLAKEMEKISLTNERLHSITIASVQQSRDEHEVTYEILERINDSLLGLNTITKNTTQVLEDGFNGMETVMQDIHNLTIQELKTDLNNLSQNIIELLENNANTNDKKSNNMQIILTSLNEKLQKQVEILEHTQTLHIDKLTVLGTQLQNVQNILSESSQNQDERFHTINLAITQVEDKIQKEVDTLFDIQELSKTKEAELQKQNKLLSSLDDNAEKSISLEQQQLHSISSLQETIKNLNEELDAQSQSNTIMLSQKLEILKNVLDKQVDNQTISLQAQDQTKELIQKHQDMLKSLLGKNDENLKELKKISKKSFNKTTESSETEKEGFFSKIFG